MSKAVAQSIVKNTSILLVQQVITWTSSFALAIFLPRYLGPVEYGRLFLAGAFIAIFRVFVEYGGNYLVARNIARSPESAGQTVVDATGFRLVVGLIAFIAACVIAITANYPHDVQVLIMIVGLSLLWKGLMTVLAASYQGLEIMQYSSVGAITEAMFMSFVSVGALLLGAKSREIALISVVAGLLNVVMLALASKRIATVFPKINWSGMLSQIKEGLPYFFLAVFGSIYYRIDAVMLSKMSSEAVVGWYGGAHRLFDVLNFFPYIFSTAVFPVLSRLYGKESQTHRLTTQRSLEFMIIIGIPVTIGAVTFAQDVIGLLYGLPAYEPSILVFRVFSFGIIFLFSDMMIGTTLLASNKQGQQSLLALAAIPLNIGMNYAMIPYFQERLGNGGVGAAIATILTELFIMIAGMSILAKGTLVGFRYRVVLKAMVAGVSMALFLLGMTALGVPWFALIITSPLVYGAVLLALNTFEQSEKDLLLSMLKWRHLRTVLTGKDRN